MPTLPPLSNQFSIAIVKGFPKSARFAPLRLRGRNFGRDWTWMARLLNNFCPLFRERMRRRERCSTSKILYRNRQSLVLTPHP
jgi:hypothetical protein